MSKPRVGHLITGSPANRDAIHVPIIEVVAGEATLLAGDPVKLSKHDDAWLAYYCRGDQPGNRAVGVVDPFIGLGAAVSIRKGDRFYCWLRPDSTKKLWHDWTHKDID